jgi:hypothetical protein
LPEVSIEEEAVIVAAVTKDIIKAVIKAAATT